MTLHLERLRAGVPIVDKSGAATLAFLGLLDRVWTQIEAQEASQDVVINRIRRLLSHTVPTTILTAVDAGTTATITVSNHIRVYADGTTVSISGGAAHTGLTSGTAYGAYYDDLTLAETAPTIILTTTLKNTYAAAAEGRHFLGIVTTPPAGSGKTFTGGGAYPPGSSVGGEVV
jgi:hypothetical protein